MFLFGPSLQSKGFCLRLEAPVAGEDACRILGCQARIYVLGVGEVELLPSPSKSIGQLDILLLVILFV